MRYTIKRGAKGRRFTMVTHDGDRHLRKKSADSHRYFMRVPVTIDGAFDRESERYIHRFERMTADSDDMFRDIRKEAYDMAQDKDVQMMLLQERFNRMDWESYGNTLEKKGEGKLATLMDKLFSLGRTDDARRASKDAKYRAELFKEFEMG